MSASFWLVFKAHIKRPSFYILVAIFIALCFLAALYDVFSLGATSTLFSEVYAGLALLLAVSVPLFCLADFLEQERTEDAFDLLLIRPLEPLSILFGRLLGAWLATSIALSSLSVTYYICIALFNSYCPAASHLVLPVTVASAVLSSALTLLFSTIGGFFTTAIALLGLLTASHLLAYFSQGVSTLMVLLVVLPNFHLANLQNDCATGTLPDLTRLLYPVVSSIAYALAMIILTDILLRLRYKPAK